MSGPIEQFQIKPIVPLHIGDYDVSFTNSSLFMVIAVFVAIISLSLATRKRTLVPKPFQSVAEILYEFIGTLLKENVGHEGKKYFPLIFSLFIFITLGNLLGLLPYSYTFTSQMGAIGGLSILFLVINTIIGIKKKKWGYLHTFFPRGIPIALAPLLVPIEMISFLSKPFSLTVRLVANMTVGHIMLKIIAGFVFALGVAGLVPVLFNGAIIVFETFIALLQAFIYTVLSCIYLSDALHDH